MASGLFLKHFGITVYRALSGFALATVLGIALGALISQFRVRRKDDLSLGGRAADGTQDRDRTAYSGVVRLRLAVEDRDGHARGLLPRAGQHDHRAAELRAEQARSHALAYRASRWLTFRMVELPNALPFIFAGLSVAAVFSILGALVGEFVGSKDGIGFLILDANYQLNIPRVFALLILLRPLRDHLPSGTAVRPSRNSCSGTSPRTSPRPERRLQFGLSERCYAKCRDQICVSSISQQRCPLSPGCARHAPRSLSSRRQRRTSRLATPPTPPCRGIHEVLGERGARHRCGRHPGRHGGHAADRRQERHLRQRRARGADDGASEGRQGQGRLHLLAVAPSIAPSRSRLPGITKTEDLRGKTMGVIAMSTGAVPYGRQMLQAAKIDPDKDVQWLPIGEGAQAALALKRGDAAAWFAWDTAVAQLEAQGIELVHIKPPYFDDLIGNVILACTRTSWPATRMPSSRSCAASPSPPSSA